MKEIVLIQIIGLVFWAVMMILTRVGKKNGLHKKLSFQLADESYGLSFCYLVT